MQTLLGLMPASVLAGVVKQDDKPLAIISMGCHASSSRGYDQQRCAALKDEILDSRSTSKAAALNCSRPVWTFAADCAIPAEHLHAVNRMRCLSSRGWQYECI